MTSKITRKIFDLKTVDTSVILIITALFCSKVLFFFFNDREGPNLLMVIVTACVIYFLSLILCKGYNILAKRKNQYLSFLSPISSKNFFILLLIQITITTAFYFCLH